MRQRAVHHSYVGDDAAIGVVDGVEDQRSGRSGRIAHRCRYLGDDLIEELSHTLTCLRRHPEHLSWIAPDDSGDFRGVLLWLGTRQIDLVENRNNVQVGVQRQIQVCQSLGLDALGRVDEEHRAFTCGE